MYQYVVTAPGQGTQQPGMLDPWLETVPGAAGLVDDWSRATGLDLAEASRHETMLADTSVAQPLIVATALLAYRLLDSSIPLAADAVLYAGHSVGELAAAAAAGYLSPEAAVRLARVRGEAMAAACALAQTGMTAVMATKRHGATDDQIIAAIAAAGLAVANWNGGHQFVAAGPADRIEALTAGPRPGIRVTRLAVAGAFHTDAMALAVEPFARAAQETPFTEPASAMVGNGDGELIAGPDDLRHRLITQITAPVRWDRCMDTIIRDTPNALHIELAPAGPLTRLLERTHPDTRAIAVSTPADINRIAAKATCEVP